MTGFRKTALWLASAAFATGAALGAAEAQDKELTLCWAAWDPNAWRLRKDLPPRALK